MTINYTCALRSQFFDITDLAARPDDMLKQSRSFNDGLLFLDGNHIVALVEWETGCQWLRHPTDYIDYRDKLIVPGFVDTHLHYPQTEMVGAWGEQLLEWLQTYTFPTESKYADSDYAAAMSAFFLNQLLANGTTTALVFGTVHPESVDALFRAASHLEMRLIAGKVMMDRNAPPYLLETPEQSYQQTRDLILRWHNKGRINYALTPRFAPTSSPELMRVVEQLREEFPDIWLHTHLSENTDEVAWVKALWPEHSSYLGVYHHYHMTGRRSVFAHAIHLEPCEWECLRDTDSSIAFCPTSNLFLGSGLFPLQTCLDHGIRVGIGTDIGAGTTFNMLQTLGEAYKVAQLQRNKLHACQAFYHATLGGAHALDLDRYIGNFMPGKEADFVVLDLAVSPLQKMRLASCHDIYEKLFLLMTLGDDRNIWHTWVNGHCVWRQDDVEKAA
ncbi:guanine deaminase [Pectobacterium colocasium]|uniref:guanine deaminase n=1 Tax=Pectobacterium TaxID=122277 RepID=UPI003B27CA8D